MSEIPNKSIDAVVSTLVLCSCDKTKEAFQEISRVLIPVSFSFSAFHTSLVLPELVKQWSELQFCIKFMFYNRVESFTSWSMSSTITFRSQSFFKFY